MYGRLRESIRRIMAGKDEVVDLCLISLLAGGHVLLTDFPGVGNTTLARVISQSIAVDYSRIQLTPGLLLSDLTGTSIFDHGSRVFSSSQGRSPGAYRTPRRRTSKGREQGQG